MIRFGLVCAITAFVGPAMGADIIMEFDRATFASALLAGTVSGQNFDGFTSGTTITTVNGVTFAASIGSPVVTDAFLTTTFPNGLGSTPGEFFQGTELATITFASPITAFGIDVNTTAPDDGAYLATLNDGAIDLSKFAPFPGATSGHFLGFTDNVPFTSVTISAQFDQGLQFPYTLDSLVYGSAAAINEAAATPEPSTFGLLAAGIGLMIWQTRRRYS